MPGKTNELLLTELEQELKASNYIFFSSFTGLKVSDFRELRNALAPSSRRCLVVKNKLARVAFKRAGHEDVANMLEGMSCIATAHEEPQAVSKVLFNFLKGREEVFKLRGALMEGRAVSGSYVAELAKLPGRQELRAKVVGSMKSPINGFVLNLRGLLQSLVLVLNAAAAKDKSAAQSG